MTQTESSCALRTGGDGELVLLCMSCSVQMFQQAVVLQACCGLGIYVSVELRLCVAFRVVQTIRQVRRKHGCTASAGRYSASASERGPSMGSPSAHRGSLGLLRYSWQQRCARACTRPLAARHAMLADRMRLANTVHATLAASGSTPLMQPCRVH